MKTFKDAAGREWQIVVDVGTAKAARDLRGVDLFKLHSSEAERVFSDPCLLVDVLYVLCRQQCEIRSISDEDFGRAMVGDAIEDGANALLGAVADFFPSPRRLLLQRQMAKAEELASEVMSAANRAIEQLDVTALVRTASRLPTDSPALSGSTPPA